MGSTTWCSTTHLNTSKLALLFGKTLGISLVALEFAKYRDVLIFGMSLARGIECTSAELEPTQADAAFALCEFITKEDRHMDNGGN